MWTVGRSAQPSESYPPENALDGASPPCLAKTVAWGPWFVYALTGICTMEYTMWNRYSKSGGNGRIVGPEARKFPGWQRLNAENWPPKRLKSRESRYMKHAWSLADKWSTN